MGDSLVGKTAPSRTTGLGADVARHLLGSLSSHAVFMLDSEGTITAWPGPAVGQYGYDAETIVGEHVSELFAERGESDTDDAATIIPAEPIEGCLEVERWHERANGTVFWGTLTISPLVGPDADGFAAISQDETATKEYERMLERQNDRLKEFTDILAHDLRNPLEVIDGRLRLYAETGDEAHIETIDETTDRMARLVDDLLRVARQGDVVTDPEPTDLEAVVETAWQVVETAWQVVGTSPTATLEHHEIPSVSADADRLVELFENLFRNSVEHGHQRVTIHVGPLETGLYVEDDGPGIPTEHQDEVFEHGFTTSSGGSGYGLSVVRTIANAHGWDIRATDAESRGARFEITGIDFLE
ncbi:ATP-binding protein [Halorhabdus sp. CBA1104]|uniref:PAS domain-containing sensor histidine kinase n=1 Tax=Halorhabdus sp. CBA1104 TaxID=1380432 RepID=UPI00351A26E3